MCLAWELGVVCEFGLSSRGDCLVKPALRHLSCSPSAKLHLSGVQSAGTCSVGWSCEEVEVGPFLGLHPLTQLG